MNRTAWNSMFVSFPAEQTHLWPPCRTFFVSHDGLCQEPRVSVHPWFPERGLFFLLCLEGSYLIEITSWKRAQGLNHFYDFYKLIYCCEVSGPACLCRTSFWEMMKDCSLTALYSSYELSALTGFLHVWGNVYIHTIVWTKDNRWGRKKKRKKKNNAAGTQQ